MKKTYKVLSTAAALAMISSSVVTPVAFANSPTETAKEISDMVFQVDDKLGKISLEIYRSGLSREIVNPKEVKHVVLDNGQAYTIEQYQSALSRTGNYKAAVEFLAQRGTPLQEKIYEATLHRDGTITIDEQPSIEDLKEAISKAEKADKEGKTDESVKALEEAIKAAKEVAEKEKATEEEIKKAIKALEDAVAGLTDAEEPVDPEVPADKKTLEQAIAKAEKADKEGKTDESVKALEEAIKAANAVLEDEEADEAAIADAIKALEDAVAGLTDAEEPAEDKIAVASVEAVNKDKVTVTLGEDVELEEDDLTGKTITITHGKQTFTATYSDNTLTEDGTAVFQLAEEELLEDAVEYKVSADWAEFANDKLVAKVAAVYIADIEFLTTGVRAQAKEQIQVIYKNQYGEDLTKEEVQKLADKNKLTVTAKKGSFPLNVSFATDDYTKVVLEDTLAKDEEFTVTITNTVKEGEGEEAKNVIKAQVTSDPIKVYDANAENVASAISKLEVVEKEVAGKDEKVNPLEDLKAGDDFELEAEVLDQFSNIMTKDFGKLRWTTSDPSIIAFGTKDEEDKVTATDKKFVDAKKDKLDMVFVAQKQGTATITVFTPDGKASKSMEITVGQGKLDKIVVGEENQSLEVPTTNKEAAEKEQTIAVNKEDELVFQNANKANVPVKAADVEFKVQEKEDSPFKASDVKIEKVVDEEGYLTAVKVTTDRSAQTEAEKAGNYKDGQDYIVEVHAKGLKQEKPATFKVNSKIDDTVTKIDTETAVEFRADQKVEQPITFTNKHGEVINVKKADLTVTPASLEAKFLATDKDGKFVELTDEDKDKVVTGVSLTSKTKGTGSAFIVKGGVSTTIKANILDSAEIKTIDLGADIREGIIAGDDKTVLRPIVVKDQDGQEMKNLKTTDLEVEPKADESNDKVPTFEIVQYGKDEDGKIVEATGDIKVEGLALSINAGSVELAKAQVFEAKVKADKNATDKEKVAEGTLKVTVNANRALDKVTIDAPQKAATVNGQLTVTLKPVDQYGDIVPGAEKLISLKDVADGETAAVKIAEDGIDAIYVDKDGKPSDAANGTLAGYKVVLDAVAKGKQEAEFIVKPKADEKDEKKFKSVKETFTVEAVDNIIESVEVTAEDEVVVTADEDKEYSTQLTATGKDKDGNEVSIAQDDITWSIKSVKDAKGEELTLVATGTKGQYNLQNAKGEKIYSTVKTDDSTEESPSYKLAVVSISEDGKLSASQGLTVTVEAQARTSNLKEATVTVDFKGDERKFAKDLVVNTVKFEGATEATPAKDLEDKGLVIKFAAEEGKAVPTKVDLTFSGIDQYGDVFEIKENYEATVGDSTIAKPIVSDEGTLTIEALAEGDANVYVNYGGENIKIAVTVTKEAIAQKEAKAAYDQALKDATKAGLNEDDLKELKVDKDNPTAADYNAATEKIKAAIEAAEKETATKKALTEEAAKYAATATIEGTVAAQADVTTTVKALTEGQTAAEGIEVTAAVQQDAQYLSVDQEGKVIKLAKQNDTGETVTEKVTLTFEKDGQKETKEVTVTIQPTAASVVQAELKAEAEKYAATATIKGTTEKDADVTNTVKALTEGKTAAEDIEVTATVQQDAQYLSVDQNGKVTLKDQNTTGQDVTETVTLTFKKGEQEFEKNVTVTIESQNTEG